MILLRIDGLGGKYCQIEGESQYGYGEDRAGWFPIESMNFGFKAKSEAATGTNSAASQGAGSSSGRGAAAGGRGAPAGAPAGGAAASEDDEAFSTISISKFVDGATTELMGFAMQDRSVTKADKGEMRTADIHFIYSALLSKMSEKSQVSVFPYMMITLADVLIRGWNISATGDDRPTESLELYYDKAAIRYFRTSTGKDWIGGQIRGWDQSINDFWQIVEGAEPPYFKAPKKR